MGNSAPVIDFAKLYNACNLAARNFGIALLGIAFFAAPHEVLSSPPPKIRPIFLAAGIPKSLGEKPNFELIFHQLKEAGISVFLPFSEYQEIPESKSLAYEREFFPQYKHDDAAINALRKNKIKLLIPAAVLYPGGKMPALSVDPLKQLIAWVGRENIYGVYNFDEPVLQNQVEQSKSLYDRVKCIDPSLPVVMVHAPIPEKLVTSADFKKHLSAVKNVSEFSDVVGFDVYAIPRDLMKIQGPYSGPGKVLDYRMALAEYIRWLKEYLPQKQHIMVLQAFSLQDQGQPPWLAFFYGDRRPTKQELFEMVQISSDAGVSVGWWGQSLVKEPNSQFWQDILEVTRSRSTSR